MTSVEPSLDVLAQLDFEIVCSVGRQNDPGMAVCDNKATHLVVGHDCTQPDRDADGYIERMLCDDHVALIYRLQGALQCRVCSRLFVDVRHWFPRIVRL
ncbi:hypothetical protein GS538_20285 [Rhodococcus hoagii]|nr:hypothetical protein [Prescottella equi]NKS69385.1 hypothetical protein [Prescottella equi]